VVVDLVSVRSKPKVESYSGVEGVLHFPGEATVNIHKVLPEKLVLHNHSKISPDRDADLSQQQRTIIETP
jgi:hypothetical protein